MTKMILPGLLLIALGAVCAQAEEPRITKTVLGTAEADKKEIVEETTEFETDTEKILCLWKSAGFGATTTIRGVWIAVDVGKAAPANFKIDEVSMLAPFMNTGSFSLSKPNKGFPVGRYKLEIYIGNTLAKTVPFTVAAD